MSEDEPLILLRRIRQHRQALIDKLARGGVSAENCAGGYRDITGRIVGFDEAEEMVLDVFKAWFPPPRS